MPRLRTRGRKHHSPRQIGDAAPQLAVDEVAEPARREAERHQRRHEIGDVEPALVAPPREEPERDQHAEKAAVEAHPALPHGKDLERVREIVERLVENDVAEAAAQDHAEHAVEQHVVDVARMPSGQQVLSRAKLAEHREQDERDEIHEPVPADGDRADLERDGIELRMDEHSREDVRLLR